MLHIAVNALVLHCGIGLFLAVKGYQVIESVGQVIFLYVVGSVSFIFACSGVKCFSIAHVYILLFCHIGISAHCWAAQHPPRTIVVRVFVSGGKRVAVNNEVARHAHVFAHRVAGTAVLHVDCGAAPLDFRLCSHIQSHSRHPHIQCHLGSFLTKLHVVGRLKHQSCPRGGRTHQRHLWLHQVFAVGIKVSYLGVEIKHRHLVVYVVVTCEVVAILAQTKHHLGVYAVHACAQVLTLHNVYRMVRGAHLSRHVIVAKRLKPIIVLALGAFYHQLAYVHVQIACTAEFQCYHAQVHVFFHHKVVSVP